MNSTDLTVVKSNKIIEAKYKLSTNEQRLLLFGISLIDSKEKLSISDEFTIPAKDFAGFWELDKKEGYKILKKASENLVNRSVRVKINDKQDKDAYMVTNWISHCIYMPNAGLITLKFAERIIPFLSSLQDNFTKYKLTEVISFKSQYSFRFYELILQWINAKEKTLKISIDDLKEKLQLNKGSYSRFLNLRVRCIEPAIKDINENTSIRITSVEYEKTGRSYTHIIFKFERLSKLKLEQAKKELEANSIDSIPAKHEQAYYQKALKEFMEKMGDEANNSKYEKMIKNRALTLYKSDQKAKFSEETVGLFQ